ncbi:putative protein phosphatases pp1 regulatory subunit [Schistosoma mansoni]|uniref:putative protein phosphatases pp1 regulatory subunit n=1 Tax=Schistosoma mansoni TaxID=6183 RepID=UPI00022DC5A6|nr:putative protein phosphatases pp1 regulatory subunit [Schistosoma mansoni]|eukprot:XP_018652993.1 putative protein phosphatases pp1 regulatory subunit [Schistosoma mansoni]
MLGEGITSVKQCRLYKEQIIKDNPSALREISMETEIELINSGIDNIKRLNLSPKITVLNLHHNHISEINGLTRTTFLRYLDLSSNYITRICGLENLQHLRVLNLSSNKIRFIDSLDNLNCLVRLDVSFNEITSLVGLKKLFGPGYSLTTIILQGNQIQSKSHILECLKNLVNLRQLVLLNPQTGDSNPVCCEPDYRLDLLQGLPQLEILDHVDRMGRSTQIDVLADLPELNGFLDMIPISSLLGSDHLREEEDKKLNSNEDQIHLPKQSADKEVKNMHSATCEQSEQHISTLSSTTERRLLNLESQLNSLITSHLMRIYQTEHIHSKPHSNVLNSSVQENNLKTCDTVNAKDETNSSRVNDTLESVHNDLCQHIPEKELGAQNLQHLNHSSTMRKQSIVDRNQPGTSTKSKSIPGRLSHKTSTEKKTKQENSRKSTSNGLVNFNNELIDQSKKIPVTMATYPTSNIQLNDHRNDMKTMNKILYEFDQEKSRRKQSEQLCQDLVNRIRELELSAIDQHKALKVTEELKQAFTTEHQEKLLQKFNDMCQIVDHLRVKEDAEKDRYEQEVQLIESTKRYTALEDEFRMALRIEAERYETERITTLEMHLEEAQTRIRNHENLRKELKQQKAEMTAQESIIAGLKAERRNWGEELAKQGSALAQDRGRLEAKIEAQELEIAGLKKSLENENDSVKIKSKVIDDQTETILNLKKDEIKRLVKRKEDLKLLVADLQSKVDELQKQNEWNQKCARSF